MKIEKTIPAAIAAAAFAFLSQVASADPVAQGSASAVDRQVAAAPQGALTLVQRGMRTRGARGMRTRGVRGTAVRGGPRTFAGRRGIGPRRAFVGGRRFAGGRRFGPRRVRVWRNGRWVWGPAFGVGIVGGGGGSCYWNCRNAGHGPGFCRANALNFC